MQIKATSLEISQKLKEAGFFKPTTIVWGWSGDYYQIRYYNNEIESLEELDSEKDVPAYGFEELYEEYPHLKEIADELFVEYATIADLANAAAKCWLKRKKSTTPIEMTEPKPNGFCLAL